MSAKIKQFGCLVNTIIILFVCTSMFRSVYAKEPNNFLEWSIGTSKQTFYPGEPVLLTLNITNFGAQEEKVDFGMDGIEAFSMEIRDLNDIIISKGGKIQKWGVSRAGTVSVTPGETAQKSIVLNRWCSTLLPPGKYHVICNIDYRLRSESIKKEGSEVYKAGPIHTLQLKSDIQLIEANKAEFRKILEALAGFEVQPGTQSKGEWLKKRDTAREMIALTESELAVPYQLQLLKTAPYTWFGPDAVNSLVKSRTLEAATGLVQIIEDPNIHKDDVKPIFIDGVYRLRDGGKSEILSATNEFVAKHKRPVISTVAD